MIVRANVTLFELLKNILDIIEFEEDSDAFIRDLEQISNKNATLALFEQLPVEQRESISKELDSSELTQEEIDKIIKKYFSEDQMQRALAEETGKLLHEFYLNVLPDLSEEKKAAIIRFEEEHLSSLQAK